VGYGDLRKGLRWVAALLCLVAALRAGTAAQAPGKSFLWKVQGGSGVMYLAGSVHALDQSVYPLSPAFQRAFDLSGALVEEIDLAETSSLAAAPMLLGKGMFQDGQTFDRVVSRETLALVTERLKDTPMGMDLIKPMKPWMVDMLLTALEVQGAGLDVNLGLDKHFFDRAAAAGKETIPLETAESQVDRMDRMPIAVQEQMLRGTLRALDRDLQPGRGPLNAVIAAWKRGDAALVEKMLLSEFEGLPAAYQSLVVERNRNWMPQLDACLARRSPCFVVVGAAHLVGPEGLLALLQRKGYRVEQQ
jgi:uncharacterized protein YbaP (TraB family)